MSDIFHIAWCKVLLFRSWPSSAYWPESLDDFIFPSSRSSACSFPIFRIPFDNCMGPHVSEPCNVSSPEELLISVLRDHSVPLLNYLTSEALTQWYFHSLQCRRSYDTEGITILWNIRWIWNIIIFCWFLFVSWIRPLPCCKISIRIPYPEKIFSFIWSVIPKNFKISKNSSGKLLNQTESHNKC